MHDVRHKHKMVKTQTKPKLTKNSTQMNKMTSKAVRRISILNDIDKLIHYSACTCAVLPQFLPRFWSKTSVLNRILIGKGFCDCVRVLFQLRVKNKMESEKSSSHQYLLVWNLKENTTRMPFQSRISLQIFYYILEVSVAQ